MSRTRLAAAAGVAALTLGATAAAADTTANQTVTITVTQIERSVTTAGDATLTIVSGAAADTAVLTGTPTIAYSNGSGGAEIVASITAIAGVEGTPDAGDLFTVFGATTALTIDLAAAEAAGSDELANDSVAIAGVTDSDDPIQTAAVLGGIPEDVDRSATAVVYGLSGAAPITVGTTALTVTFTIGND
jgi:hypothetical protein